MRINPNKSELQNVLDHVNEINEWNIYDKDIRRIIPYELFPLPLLYVKADLNKYEWNDRNTYLELAPGNGQYRWSEESQVYYRRIHLGLQMSIYLADRAKRGETGKVTVWFDVDKSPVPVLEDYKIAMNLLGDWLYEAVDFKAIDVVDKGYEFPLEATVVATANNSLCYIGQYRLPVFMMPKPPLPPLLDGFVLPDNPYRTFFDENYYGFDNQQVTPPFFPDVIMQFNVA